MARTIDMAGAYQANAGQMNILVICAGQAVGVGVVSALRTASKPSASQEFQFTEVVLRGNAPEQWIGFRAAIARQHPDLLLLCVTWDWLMAAPAAMEEVRRELQDIPLLLALDVVGEKGLSSLPEMDISDVVVAPFSESDILPRIRRLCRDSNAAHPCVDELKSRLGLQQLIGGSPELVAAIKQIPKFAACDATVLLNGETVTGKELFARAILYLRPRAANPFIPVNCGAIPAELMENELFGHEPGAFTGAAASTRGLIAEAESGTLFLDEIDSLTLSTQVKLLRFLQDHVYRPLGSRKLFEANIRILAASNTRLEQAVRLGRFRADLFYRINVLSLALPPLRERQQDIPALARHFAAECAREMKTPPKELSPAAIRKLMSYHWPGNVRELQNIIQRATVLGEDNMIGPLDLELPGLAMRLEASSFKALKARVIEDFERSYLQQLLAEHDGNITRAARAADKNRRALWELLRKHQIHLPRSIPDRETPVDKPRLY